MLLHLLPGDSILVVTGCASLFVRDSRLDFVMLCFILLILEKKNLHFLGFYFIYNLWKEVEHSCVLLYRILNSKTTQPTP